MSDETPLIEGERIQVHEPAASTLQTCSDDVAERLSRMPDLEYEKVRKAEAKALNIRVGALDKQVDSHRRNYNTEREAGIGVLFPVVEPWPDAVDGAALLDDLSRAVSSHVALPAGAADAVALWIMHAHTHETAGISPILGITSPTPECGKTTLMTVLGALVPRPLPSSNITTAALFRAVEKWGPTVLIDEADTFLRKNDDLRGVINSGHNRANAFVIRTIGDDHEPCSFCTWAPKAIALIGKLPATLESRAIPIELKRLAPDETVVPLRADRLDHLDPLLRKAVRWASDHQDALQSADPVMPAALRGRRADNWRHLLAISDAAGGAWPERARLAARALHPVDEGRTAGVTLLEDIRMIFSEKGVDRLPSWDLVEALASMEDRPWPEWKPDRPITPSQVAELLKPFGIAPTKFRADGHTPGTRGYDRRDFDDVFKRYLTHSPDQSATTPHASQNNSFTQLSSATPGYSVADDAASKARAVNACGAVADKEHPYWTTEL